MACLINSLDELPKSVVMDWPTTEEGWVEFAQNYVCVANGQEVPFDEVDSIDADTVAIYYSTTPSGDDYIKITISAVGPSPKGLKKSAENETISAVGYGIFDPLTSLTLCEKSSGGKTICGVPVCDDGKEGLVITPTSTKIGNEYAGVSTQNKPTGVPQYSLYLELDTGKFYYYDNGEWNEIPCGGGSSEPEDTRPYIILIDDIPLEDVLISSNPDFTPLSISELIGEGVIEFKDGKYYIDADGAETLYFFAFDPDCYVINGDESVTVSSPVEVPISPSLEIVISACSN